MAINSTEGTPSDPEPPVASAWQRRLPLWIVLLVPAIVFLPVLRGDFIIVDDPVNVYLNPLYHPLTGATLWRLWSAPYHSLYTPVTNTLWGLITLIARLPQPQQTAYMGVYDLDPVYFHLLNFVVHIANTVVLFFLLRRLLERWAGAYSGVRPQTLSWAAVIGALLFALHPAQVESVAWITGVNNVLSTGFALVSLYLYVGSDRPERYWYEQIGATLLFGLALLSKPTVVVLPLAFLAWELLYRRPRPQPRFSPLLLLQFLLAATIGLITARIQPHQNAAYFASLSAVWQRPFIAGDALAFYLYRLGYLGNFCFEYGRNPGFVLRHWWGYATWIFPVIPAALLLFFLSKENRAKPKIREDGTLPTVRLITFGTVLAIVALLPVLGLIPFYFQPYSTVADRYLYFALPGVAIAATIGIAQLLSCQDRRFATGGIAIATLFLCLSGWQARRYIAAWSDSEKLLANIARVNPNSAFLYDTLGILEQQRSNPAAAIQAFSRALELKPDFTDARLRRAVLYFTAMKQPTAAEQDYQILLQQVSLPEAESNLAQILVSQKRLNEAIPHLRRLVEETPNDPVAHFMLGKTLYLQGDANDTESITEYQRGLTLLPGNPQAELELQQVMKRAAASPPPHR